MDKQYIDWRNSLIPEAVLYADKTCGWKCEGTTDESRAIWVANWNKAFHGKMNELALTADKRTGFDRRQSDRRKGVQDKTNEIEE
jgi:hypothetical protein